MPARFRLFTLILLFGLCSTAWLQAQDTTFTISGKITDSFTRQVLDNLNISVEGTHMGSVSNQFGIYSFRIPWKKEEEGSLVIVYSHVGYATQKITVQMDRSQRINISMDLQQMELNEVVISDEPEVIFGNFKYQLFDYELMDDFIVLIGYEKRLSKSTLLLLDQDQKLLSSHRIPGKPIKLHRDCTGELYVTTEYYYFRIGFEDNSLFLSVAEQELYNRLVNACVEQNGADFYFEYYLDQLYSKNFYRTDTSGHPPVLIRGLSDRASIRQLRDEQAFFKAGYYRTGRGMEFERDFAQRIFFQPPYIPLFVEQDTVLVFNHLDGYIEKLDRSGNLYATQKIDYHEDRRWNRKVFHDKIKGGFYTATRKNGFLYVNRINLQTGALETVKKTHYRYIEKITVQNGFLYFLYRPTGSLQKKYLYREPL